jgi:HEAT repeat protein
MAHPDRLVVLRELVEAKACDPQVVHSLLVQLGHHSVPAVCEFLEQSTSERSRRVYAGVLAEIGEPAVLVVVERFRRGSGSPRGAFALALGGLRGEIVVSTLLEGLSEPDGAVRREVVRALAAQTSARATAALLRIGLEDPEAGCRIIALRGLGRSRTQLNPQKLLERIESAQYASLDAEEKDLLFRALGTIGDENVVVPALRKVLTPSWIPGRQRRDDWERAAAALAGHGSAGALGVLEELTRSRRSDLASVCATALRNRRQQAV